MRSIRMLAVTGTLVLGSACGGGGTGPNTPPVAAFTQVCTGRACAFTDASTDDNGVTARTWDFNDPNSGANNSSTVTPANHTFTVDGTYNVTLTVTDAGSATATKTTAVTVANAAPAAAFTPACDAGVCTFTNTSTDADGTVASSSWNFGDGSAVSAEASPTHTYTVTAVTPYTVTLTVTDNNNATATTTQGITISPPAGLQCNGVDCTLNITSKAILTVTLTTRDCQFTGNAFTITQPIQQTLFTDGCSVAPNTVYTLNGPNADKSFAGGTSLQAAFTQGNGTPASPPKGPAATRVTGSFPDWTIAIDDGGAPTSPGEPDFNDIILAVHATVVP